MNERAVKALLAGVLLALLTASSVPAQGQDQNQDQDQEAQLGQQTWQDLKEKGVIVSRSPLYDVLRPIERQIAPIAQKEYKYPIHFYIVHSKQPNAFAAPGGNIYVIDSLFYFVHSREELAGTLCHETSHLIYHDSMTQMKHDQEIEFRQALAELILGPSLGNILVASVLGNLDSLHYSRGVEERADLKGADTCAAAGINPWGLVWLMNDFNRADVERPPEFLSDHPNDQHRIQQLQTHFKNDPARFARFPSDPKTATAIKLPKNPPPEKLLEQTGSNR